MKKPLQFLLMTACCTALAGCASFTTRRAPAVPPPPGAPILPAPPLAPPPVGPSGNTLSVAPARAQAAPRELYNMTPERKPARTVASKPTPAREDIEEARPVRKVVAAKKTTAPAPEAAPIEAVEPPAPVTAPAPPPAVEEPAPAAPVEDLDETPFAIPEPKGSGVGVE